MQDEDIRELFHRAELRLERLDTKVDGLEKTVADVKSGMRARFEGIANRLHRKAGNGVVTFWGARWRSSSVPRVRQPRGDSAEESPRGGDR